MKDYLGNELNIGDKVVYLMHWRTSSKLCTGYIKELKPKMAVIVDELYDDEIATLKSYQKIIKVV